MKRLLLFILLVCMYSCNCKKEDEPTPVVQPEQTYYYLQIQSIWHYESVKVTVDTGTVVDYNIPSQGWIKSVRVERNTVVQYDYKGDQTLRLCITKKEAPDFDEPGNIVMDNYVTGKGILDIRSLK